MILAVAELKQPVWRGLDIATDRATIHPHPTGTQIVHADQVPTHLPLKGLPLLIVTQGIQHRGQAIIDFHPGRAPLAPDWLANSSDAGSPRVRRD